jgi:hypothetical protein
MIRRELPEATTATGMFLLIRKCGARRAVITVMVPGVILIEVSPKARGAVVEAVKQHGIVGTVYYVLDLVWYRCLWHRWQHREVERNE